MWFSYQILKKKKNQTSATWGPLFTATLKGSQQHLLRDRYTTRSRFYSISAINSQNYVTASNQSLRIVPKYVTFSALRGTFLQISTTLNVQLLRGTKILRHFPRSYKVSVDLRSASLSTSLLSPVTALYFSKKYRGKVSHQHRHHLQSQICGDRSRQHDQKMRILRLNYKGLF